jgi:hypothetical protein
MVFFYNISLRAVFVARHNILPRNKKNIIALKKILVAIKNILLMTTIFFH